MILPLRYYREFGWLKTLKISLAGVLKQFSLLGSGRRRRRAELGKGLNPPRLKKNETEGSPCISCMLCAKICPTSAIAIEVDNHIQFPSSLKSGPAPKTFEINAALCIKCSLCVDACPVDALTPCVP